MDSLAGGVGGWFVAGIAGSAAEADDDDPAVVAGCLEARCAREGMGSCFKIGFTLRIL